MTVATTKYGGRQSGDFRDKNMRTESDDRMAPSAYVLPLPKLPKVVSDECRASILASLKVINGECERRKVQASKRKEAR